MRVGSSMTEVLGGTPVVQLRRVVPPDVADVFVKLEWFNPTGSYLIFEPDSSPVITTGEPGVNSDEGIGIMPPLLDLDRFDGARAISESESFDMARRLAAEEGLLAGGFRQHTRPGHTRWSCSCRGLRAR